MDELGEYFKPFIYMPDMKSYQPTHRKDIGTSKTYWGKMNTERSSLKLENIWKWKLPLISKLVLLQKQRF